MRKDVEEHMPQPAQLAAEEGPHAGRRFSVPRGGTIEIGRSSSNDISLEDLAVSRFHCRVFSKEDGSLWITDLGSANRTLVNDEPVETRQIRTNDRLTVGDTVFRVVSDGTGDAAASPDDREKRDRRVLLQSVALAVIVVVSVLIFVNVPRLPCRSSAGMGSGDFCEILIATDPSPAKLFLDRKACGASPVALNVPSGPHLIVAKKRGYVNGRKTVRVAQDQTNLLVRLRLQKIE